MSDKTKVTTHQPFCTYEDEPLFAVNAGVSVEDALEVAANLMLYVEQLAAADALWTRRWKVPWSSTLARWPRH